MPSPRQIVGGGNQNKRSRPKNLDKILILINRTRINQDKKDRTEDAVSHVTETGIGTATDPNPEMDASPLLHHGPHISISECPGKWPCKGNTGTFLWALL